MAWHKTRHMHTHHRTEYLSVFCVRWTTECNLIKMRLSVPNTHIATHWMPLHVFLLFVVFLVSSFFKYFCFFFVFFEFYFKFKSIYLYSLHALIRVLLENDDIQINGQALKMERRDFFLNRRRVSSLNKDVFAQFIGLCLDANDSHGRKI